MPDEGEDRGRSEAEDVAQQHPFAPCAVEGMHLMDGHDVLVAEGADAFADAVVRLYGDASLWHRLSTNGRENIRKHFSLDAARNAVRRIFF